MIDRKQKQWLKNLASAQGGTAGETASPPAGESEEAPSRSQLKRESAAIQKLGEELCKLPGHVLLELGVDEELREAMLVWQKTVSHEGKRRQMQYVGRLMRDADTSGLLAAWQRFRADGAASSRTLHEIEQLRQRLMDNAHEAWSEVFSRFPGINRPELEQLVREAQMRQKAGGSPHAFRAVFRLLREAEDARMREFATSGQNGTKNID